MKTKMYSKPKNLLGLYFTFIFQVQIMDKEREFINSVNLDRSFNLEFLKRNPNNKEKRNILYE